MSEEFRQLVDERGRELRAKSRAELLDMECADAEIVEINGRHGTIALIVEQEREGGLRVVLQGFLQGKWFKRFKSVDLDGFRMDSSGNISPLRDEEFYEFD